MTGIYLPIFLSYKREVFILGVLGVLKMTRACPKFSEDIGKLPKATDLQGFILHTAVEGETALTIPSLRRCITKRKLAPSAFYLRK